MHKNAKKQFDLQGLVQDRKLTVSYDNGYRAVFRGWPATSSAEPKPLPRETVDSCGCYVPASRYTCQSGRCSKNRYANEYAPEHLEIHTCRPREVVFLLKNHSSFLIGENTAEIYADKIAGPNHILPTGDAARYTGGLWVGMFLKVVTHMEVDRQASVKLAGYAETQGVYEGMDAHRFAAAIRIRDLKD